MASQKVVIQAGAMMFLPHPLITSPGDAGVVWTVDSGGSGWQFPDRDGIVMNTGGDPNHPLEPGFSPWPEGTPQPQFDGEGYVVTTPPNTGTAVKYQFSINLVKMAPGIAQPVATFHWDPEMENNPQP
jgi:hypothetical protein